MKTMLRLGLLMTILTGVLLVSCGEDKKSPGSGTPTAQGSPVRTSAPAGTPTGTLRLAISTFGLDNLDPTLTDQAQEMSGPMADFLVWPKSDGGAGPGIASSWQIAPDGKSWTFTLREMKFHNGAAVTAEDVKFSMERVLRPESLDASADLFRGFLDGVDVVSPSVVRVRTKTPQPLLDLLLSPMYTSIEGMVFPAAAVKAAGEKAFFRKPVGSGPWQFVSYEAGSKVTYEPAPSRHPFRGSPSFSRYELLRVPEESARLALLRTGGADIVEMSFDSVSTVRGAGLQVATIPDNSIIGALFFGNGNPTAFAKSPTSNKLVRQALTLAINREEIQKTLYGGVGTVPARYPMVPGMVGYDSSWTPDPYDPGRAKQLLAQAGYPQGFSIKYWSFERTGVPSNTRLTQAIAGYWAAVGVKAEIAQVDFAAVRAAYLDSSQKEAVGTVLNLFAETAPVPSVSLTLYYASPAAGGFFALLPTPEMDKQVQIINSTLDQNERVKAVRAAVELAHSEYVTIPLITGSGIFGAASNIRGWEPIRGVLAAGLFIEKVRR